MAMRVCLLLSASVQCLLRLSQNETETEDCEDMATESAGSKAAEDMVAAATVTQFNDA